jgi:hypothetical protein
VNERIKELALECYNPYSNFDHEKFAELIVQECVNIVEGLSPGYKDYRDQIEDAFRRDCVEEIKHQFGAKG